MNCKHCDSIDHPQLLKPVTLYAMIQNDLFIPTSCLTLFLLSTASRILQICILQRNLNVKEFSVKMYCCVCSSQCAQPADRQPSPDWSHGPRLNWLKHFIQLQPCIPCSAFTVVSYVAEGSAKLEITTRDIYTNGLVDHVNSVCLYQVL